MSQHTDWMDRSSLERTSEPEEKFEPQHHRCEWCSEMVEETLTPVKVKILGNLKMIQVCSFCLVKEDLIDRRV